MYIIVDSSLPVQQWPTNFNTISEEKKVKETGEEGRKIESVCVS